LVLTLDYKYEHGDDGELQLYLQDYMK
jgi:hypothetical protein